MYVYRDCSRKMYIRTSRSFFQVAWLRVDTQTILTIANHVITKNHRIGVTHTERKTWHLHIRDVSESDRGAYMCQINTDPMKSQTGYLDVVGWLFTSIIYYIYIQLSVCIKFRLATSHSDLRNFETFFNLFDYR